MSVLRGASGNRSGASTGLRGFRNRIINGDFRIAQRGSGPFLSGALSYTLDRWYVLSSGAGQISTVHSSAADEDQMYTAASTADASLAAADLYFLGQRIEGRNVKDLVWGYPGQALSITISFEIYSSLTGTFAISVRNITATRSWLGSFTINAVNNWERKTITIPGDTTGTWETGSTAGFDVALGLGIGSTYQGAAGWNAGNYLSMAGMTNFMASTSNNWYLRKFQLEAGSSATEFERVPYDVQFQRCLRYYETSPTNGISFAGYMNNTSVYVGNYDYKVTKRTVPTLVVTDAGSSGNFGGIGTYINEAKGCQIGRTATATVGYGYWHVNIIADAEL